MPNTPSERFNLAGKTAFVTGSTRGIGKAIAMALQEHGARVVLHGRSSSEQAQATLREARERDPDTRVIYQDMSAKDASEQIQARLSEHSPEPDILVLNSAVQTRKAFCDVESEDIDWQVQTNFTANYQLVQKLSPPMLDKGWGRVLCIGSVQESLPHPLFSVYAAMKSAQKNLVENLARQFGPKGVTVNNLSPGVFVTDRNEEALSNPDYAKLVRSKIPVGFFAESEDCAGAALLLCSPAGRYINGATLAIDGGMSLPQ